MIFSEDCAYKLSFTLSLTWPQASKKLKSTWFITKMAIITQTLQQMEGMEKHSILCVSFFWKSKVREMTVSKTQLSPVFSPMTQKGFLANFSLPLHPLYRQQQPAAHILTMYSTPNTTMVTISWGTKHNDGINAVTWKHMQWHCTANKVIPTRMYKALSELFLNSLMVANTESIRQEKTKRNLKKGTKKLLLFHLNLCHL